MNQEALENIVAAVVLGFSRPLWAQFYSRQTMRLVMQGLDAAFHYFILVVYRVNCSSIS